MNQQHKQQTQTFTYENISSIQSILQSTYQGVDKIKIDFEQKLIEYTINRKEWIRLNDLVDLIKNGIIQFNIVLIYNLFESLLLYVNKIQWSKVEHDYLDMNRIWIKIHIQQSDKKLNEILYEFKIFFTGYQCPFYELSVQSFEKSSVKNKIVQIIIQIIQEFIDIKLNNIKEKQNLIDLFLYPLLDICTSQNINYVIQQMSVQMNQIDKHYKKKIMTLDQWFKLNLDNIVFEKEGIYRILKQDQQQKNYYESYYINQNNQLNSNSYSGMDKKIFIDQSPDSLNRITSIIYNIQMQFQEEIKKRLVLKFKALENYLKFDFKNEENQMVNDINAVLTNHPIFKYFQNSVWYQSYNLQELLESVALERMNSLIDERFDLELQLKILELIQELI